MKKVPSGFRFEPSEEEIFHYIRNKIEGEPLTPEIVDECDIYGNKEPWKIFDQNLKEVFYVFTKLKKKSKSRTERMAGRGTWDGRQTNEVKDHNGKLIGYDKYFVFGVPEDLRTDTEIYGQWTMHEFSLIGEEFNDYVFCVIRNKDSKKNLENQIHNADELVRATKPHDKRQGNGSERLKQRNLNPGQKNRKQKKMHFTGTMDSIDVEEKEKIGNPCLLKSNLSERTQKLGPASTPIVDYFTKENIYMPPYLPLSNQITEQAALQSPGPTSSSDEFGKNLMGPCTMKRVQSSMNVVPVQTQDWTPTMSDFDTNKM